MTKRYDFTEKMSGIVDESTTKLGTFYCREDFEDALRDYREAPEDSIKFRKHDIEVMCEARDIDADDLIAGRFSLQQIPSRAELKDDLLETFYSVYANAPSNSDYMERMVHRLAPEYSSDTVRLAILKKFVCGAGESFSKFNVRSIIEWAIAGMTKEELAEYEGLSGKRKTEYVISKLSDDIFNCEDEKVELTNEDILKLIIVCSKKYVKSDELEYSKFSFSKDCRALVKSMLSADSTKESDNDIQMLEYIAEKLEKGEISQDNPQLITLIETAEMEFVEQLSHVNFKNKKGESVTADTKYKQAKKDRKKSRKEKLLAVKPDIALLEMCDDMARGVFRNAGKTKRYLYYFAFMFDMKLPIEGRICPSEKNIITNLFQDYYNDNTLRFLVADADNVKKNTTFEKEPTGEGINYKNFAEMIYIYFLYHDELKMTPGEKIDKAEAVIDECIKGAGRKEYKPPVIPDTHTKAFKDTHLAVLLEKEIPELADYILQNYRVKTDKGDAVPRITIDSHENTAYQLIEEIIEDIDSFNSEFYIDIYSMFDIVLKKDLTREIKADMVEYVEKEFDWKIKNLLKEKYSTDEDFQKVIDAIDSRTHIKSIRFNKKERERMMMVLRVIASFSSQDNPLSIDRIKTQLIHYSFPTEGYSFTRIIKNLVNLGYDIKKITEDGIVESVDIDAETNNAKKEKQPKGYFLDNREYDDELLDSLFRRVSKQYFSVNEESDTLLKKIIASRISCNKLVTRCELIALHFNYYITTLKDNIDTLDDNIDTIEDNTEKSKGNTDRLDTFSKIYDEYEHAINLYLTDARYQPLSSKNIFDMYIITALYFYIVENLGYL